MKRYSILFLASFFLLAGLARAQSTDFGFSYKILPNGNQISILPDATVFFPDTAANVANPTQSQISSVTFTVTNRGTTSATLNSITIVGGPFKISSAPLLPAVIPANQTATFNVDFQPAQLGALIGTLRLDFVGRTVNFNLSGNGTGSVLVFDFTVGATTRTVSANDTLTLPQTNVGDKTTATMRVRNTGNADATISFLASTDAVFALTNVPFLPFTLPAGSSFSFTINFAPVQTGTFTARLKIADASFNLSAVGAGATLTYTVVVGQASTTLAVNGTVIFTPTQVGAISVAQMQITNTGNTVAFINSISVTAPSAGVFALPKLPVLPVKIDSGATASFEVAFAPTTVGQTTGTLKIDNQTFNLSGVGLGAALTYTVVVGSGSSTLALNGTVIFTPSQVGATSSAQIQITNTGNTVAFVNSISVTPPAIGVFALPNVPALPLKIDGGASAAFDITFAPIVLGQTAGTLKIDNQTFNLSGVGNPPPALPGVSFAGATAAVDAAQQMSVGITLDNPYPVQLDGKLILSFASAADVFSDDPAIQFASGGRVVNFVIPANSRNAVFGLSDSRIRFQTGTVAGTITLAATFATDAGGINLTQNGAPATNLSVRPAAPRITSAQLVSRTLSGFTVVVTGYSSTRSVNTLDFAFTPYVDPNNKDLKLDTTTTSLAAQGPFNVWYQSVTSQAFGSLFTAVVNFNVAGNIEAIQSVSVKMSNSVGASNSTSVTLK